MTGFQSKQAAAQNQATQNSMANTTMGLGQSLATYGLACGLPKGLFK